MLRNSFVALFATRILIYKATQSLSGTNDSPTLEAFCYPDSRRTSKKRQQAPLVAVIDNLYGQTLFLNRLNRNAQRDLVTDIGRIFAHVKITALDDGGGVGAASVFLEHGMGHALERGDGQGHGLADAF